MVVVNEQLKDALSDMIEDIDRHFPLEVLNDEYCKWFYEKYIEPILKTQGITD